MKQQLLESGLRAQARVSAFVARESSWTISQAYEAFETFLKDISAILFLENQGLAETKKVEKFLSDKKSNNSTKTDVIFWRRYIDYHFRTNADKLKNLRRICPDIFKGETANNRKIDLTEWFPVVEELRHSATHPDSVIRANRMKNWSKTKRQILKQYFPGTEVNKGYHIDIAAKDATFCLNLFSEYSFQVYKSLSVLVGYDWNILMKKNGD